MISEEAPRTGYSMPGRNGTGKGEEERERRRGREEESRKCPEWEPGLTCFVVCVYYYYNCGGPASDRRACSHRFWSSYRRRVTYHSV